MSQEDFLQLVQQKKQEQDVSSRFTLYETPLVTVDIVLFTIIDGRLKVLLIQRKRDPFIHSWAIPGGFIHTDESLEEAASRHLRDETNVANVYLKQLHTFGEPTRDPRSRVITVSYYALVSAEQLELHADHNAESVDWFCVTELPKLAFDHDLIVSYAQDALKIDIETTNIAFQLLPEKFTLTELQRVYELILNKSLDKRNFRKKILSMNLLQDIGESKMDGYHRPAQLYSFTEQTVTAHS